MVKSNLILYLLGNKGLRVLEALIDAGFTPAIKAVIFAPDKAVRKDYSEEITALCLLNNIPVWSRTSLEASSLKSEYAMAIGWRWIIDKTQHHRVIVFHDSLLPKYRGFAPLVSQLINGETTIGVTVLFAVDEYDKGPIISQRSVDIKYPIKVDSAIKAIIPLYQEQALTVLENITDNIPLVGLDQDESQASYSVWRDDKDLQIDWGLSGQVIRRLVDATGFPFNGAYTMLDGRRIELMEVEEVEDLHLEFRHVGKTIRFDDEMPVIICGSGMLKVVSARWYDSKENIAKWPRFRMRFE
ncbi:MAG: methionyl-tRNA formyltransferase [Flavobacteriales bacterium]|nr:hypothetical protein [Flavobacteriales bacterium]MCB9190109.1 methionyl-tRNA formyltransferase [Flavobacteriales bacterium]MCB9205085.1 methionyl-tRNA formyltransferase [Flavobacteriales bacterium]